VYQGGQSPTIKILITSLIRKNDSELKVIKISFVLTLLVDSFRQFLISHSLTAVFMNHISRSLFVFRSSFVVYNIKYLGHNTKEKQSESTFSLFEVHITLGFKSEVFAFITN